MQFERSRAENALHKIQELQGEVNRWMSACKNHEEEKNLLKQKLEKLQQEVSHSEKHQKKARQHEERAGDLEEQCGGWFLIKFSD